MASAKLPPWWLAVCLIGGSGVSSDCVFDCRANQYCGSVPIHIKTNPYRSLVFSDGSIEQEADAKADEVAITSVTYVDLSGRGITGVSTTGLDCAALHGIDAIDLHNNSIVELPHLSTFGSLQFVSLNDNRIQRIDANYFNGSTNDQLHILLNNNAIKELPTALFSGFLGSRLNVFLGGNLISSLKPGIFSGATVDLLQLWLNGNVITHLGAGTFADFGGYDLSVYLQDNEITDLEVGAFSGQFNDYVAVFLENNAITTLEKGLFAGFNGLQLNVYFQNNGLKTIETGVFSGFNGTWLEAGCSNNAISILEPEVFVDFLNLNRLYLYLNNNTIANLEPNHFANFTGVGLFIFLNNNSMDVLASNVFLQYTGDLLNLYLADNSISVVNPDLFSNFDGRSLGLVLDNNIISTLAPKTFVGFTGETLIFSAQNNLLTTLEPFIFYGFRGTLLRVVLDSNSITYLAKSVLSDFSGVKLEVELNSNLLSHLDPNVFEGINLGSSLAVGLDYNLLAVLEPKVFSSFYGTALVASFNSNMITSLPADLFSGFVPAYLTVSFRNNLISTIEPTLFSGFEGSNIYLLLDNNYITRLTAGVFFSDFDGVGLAVSLTNNNIAYLAPGFSTGMTGNNIFRFLAGNPLQCAAYTPALVNCTCADTDTKFYQKCGYGVCSATSLACDAGTYPTQNCQYAPRSECIAVCPNVSEYMKVTSGDTPTAICFPISSCGTAFPYANQTGFYKAYQLANATQFDDTVCLRCTECAEGFVTTPCTATQDSSCTRTSDQLSSGQIAAIVLVSLAVAVAGVYLGWWGLQHKSGKEQTLRSYAEQTETLELTTKLLGVEEQKVADTELAWKVRWEDIELGDKLGAGAFGVVSKGQWLGSMVAVKVLNPAVMMFDVDSTAFEREVTAMRALHHPNLVTFYGFGTSANGKPFLVTELMFETLRQRLSWRKTSEDETGLGVDWGEARRWCADIVAGMLFLHTREPPMLHRDLKSDNCLLGENDLVKIADFGTVARPKDAGIPSVKHVEDDESLSGSLVMTASIFAGTPLWMAPEVMSGKHGWSHYGLPVDVYSFGMVMFEIATRLLPFPQCDKLSYFDFNDFVTDGGRPLIPTETLPRDYEQLMVRCWHANPNLRPVFTDVAHAITTMNVSLR
eukprot:m.229146 g.229146  ORF g.229146 m.229146 type:complete len:1146 (+) comp33553_c0_seq4:214-3651(+)